MAFKMKEDSIMKVSLYFVRWVALSILSCCLASPALAAGTLQKLGFINTERVYRESKQAQSIQDILEKEFGARQQALLNLQAECEVAQKVLATGNLKGAKRDAQVKKLTELLHQYRNQQAKLIEDYNLRRNEEFAALQQNANNVIINLARKEGYDLIIQDAIYVDSKFDITDSVIKALNAY